MAPLKPNQKGMTLIELLVYMSMFSIMMLTVTSSLFYLQKIIQNNNHNYYVKNQIYRNLAILQEHLRDSSIVLDNQELSLFSKNGTAAMAHHLEDDQPVFVYRDKKFNPYHQINFQGYSMSLVDKNRLLKFEISWLDTRGRRQVLVEYLIVINHIL
jgi:prepilin-type N-terminal cleavage/methylation domain-containing protein